MCTHLRRGEIKSNLLKSLKVVAVFQSHISTRDEACIPD